MKASDLCRLAFTLLLGAGCASTAVQKPVAAPVPSKAPVARSKAAPTAANANALDRPTTMSPSVLTGTLTNGLRYYALHHNQPEGRVSLWLVVKAGSVLEDDDQRGAAHFVEHMAFNGTQYFPKLEIQHLLRGMGMSLGADMNGQTGLESTHYRLTLPTDVPGAVSRGLSFLRDVAELVSFDPQELEQERGVVIEEWREGRGMGARLSDAHWPILFQGSRFADRMPIGSTESLRSMTRDSLLRFYRDWYRPDLMAVIAVGDMTAKSLKRNIERQFSDLRASPKPRTVEVPPVPRDHPFAVHVGSDPEGGMATLSWHEKLPPRAEVTKRDYRSALVEMLAMNMMRSRLRASRGLDSPYTYVSADADDLTRDTRMRSYTATIKDGRLEAGLRTLFAELASVARHGFSGQELEIAKRKELASIDQHLRGDGWVSSDERAEELMRHFLEQEQVPGRRLERAWVHELLPTITLEEVSSSVRSHGDALGKALFLNIPAGVPSPTEEQVRGWSREASLDPPGVPGERVVTKAPLLARAPRTGSVVETNYDEAAGVTIWKLSNGVKVVARRTSAYREAIRVRGFVPGGWSRVSDKDLPSAAFASDIVARSGAGPHSEREIDDLLSGKEVSVTLDLSSQWSTASIDTNAPGLETALQLLHLQLTEPKQTQLAFSTWRATQLGYARGYAASAEARFWDAVWAATKPGSPSNTLSTPAAIEQVNPQRSLELFRESFANFNGATFIFVGRFERDKLRPLVETYLGSLPSKTEVATWKELQPRHPTAKVERTVHAGLEPRSKVFLEFSSPERFSVEAERDLAIFERVLDARLQAVLREDMGSVYRVSARAWLERQPKPRRFLRIVFDCAPENVDKLRRAVFAQLSALAASGVSAQDLEPIARQVRRSLEIEHRSHDWWFRALKSAYVHGDAFSPLIDIDATVQRVTSANLSATARRLFDPKHYVSVVLRPEPSRP